MPESTLIAFADHGKLGDAMSLEQADFEGVMRQFTEAGVDPDALALQLQDEGVKLFARSWDDLMNVIRAKSSASERAGWVS
jgi:transaldolase